MTDKENQEQSREELILEIADVIGKAKQKPSLKAQLLSGSLSFVVRAGFFAYAGYLAVLFNHRFAGELTKTSSGEVTSVDAVLLFLAVGFMAYLIFRKVAKDRFTPIREFLFPILSRAAKIVLVAVAYMWLFGASSTLASSDFLVLIATFFILNTGYDFKLSAPQRPENPPVA